MNGIFYWARALIYKTSLFVVLSFEEPNSCLKKLVNIPSDLKICLDEFGLNITTEMPDTVKRFIIIFCLTKHCKNLYIFEFSTMKNLEDFKFWSQ